MLFDIVACSDTVFFFNLCKLNKDIPEYQMDLLVTMRAEIKITVSYQLQPTKNK